MFIVSLILLLVITSGGLFFLLRHLLTRNVTDATSHMQRMIKGYSEKEEEVKKKLEEADQQYQDALKNAKNEIEELKDKFKKESDEEKELILSQAHRESEILLTKARNSCEAMKKEMEKTINNRAIEHSGELICKVMSGDVRKMLHDMWAEALLSSNFAELERMRIPEDVSKAEISSAIALTKTQKETIEKSLKKKLKREIEMSEKVNPDMVAGIIIKLGNLVLDGSFASKVKGVVCESTAVED
ncbi:MAG: hypothetical protein GY853_09315 [PVC group bacterium]|nr:hypothetical protein [PVC group bacterium]